MSPAPVRERASIDRFPHGWGYGLGAVLIIAGIAVAVWGVVSGVSGFADDVNDLRRVIDGSALEESLEAGEEIVVYDEAGIGAGPFDVTVIRTSDGAGVATTSIVDGTTYDVDGNSGEAKVGFRVPTSDIYRIEVDTSVGQIARFAVGGEINSRSSRVVQGIALGALLALAGLVAIVWTLILHARWRVRHAVLGRVQQARTVVEDSAEVVTAEAQEDRVADATQQAAGWARERLDQARARLEAEGDHGQSPQWRQRLSDEARKRIDQADAALRSAEPAVGEALSGSEAPDELAGRVGEALDRIEERISAGESLRDIARDERVVAEQAARELADRADAARADVEREVTEARTSTRDDIREQVAGLTTDLSDIADTALETALGQTGDAGDDLATGLAATGTAAAAAAGAAATSRGRDALGFDEPDQADLASTLPPPPGPPGSSLPAPPTAPVSAGDDTAPPMPPPAVVEQPDAQPEVAHAVRDAPAPEIAEPVVDPQPEIERREPVVASASVLAPPPAVRPLAPPPMAHRVGQPAAPAASSDGDQVRPVTPLDTFSALRPAPGASPRPRSAPIAPSPASAEAHAAADEPSEESHDDRSPEPRSFALAPPPDYGALGASSPQD